MKRKYIVFGLICLLAASCSKSLDTKPNNLIITSAQFASDSKANDAVVGMYATMCNNTYSSLTYSVDFPLYTGLSADELYTTYPAFFTEAIYNNNALQANDAGAETLWSSSYNDIYNANAVIENVASSTGITAAGKSQFTGEAKFLRALNYFYLVNMFGPVPLAVTSDYHLTAGLARTPVKDIYTQMISDLKAAAALLKDTYPTKDRVRANKSAALALLARVYLYNQDWADAEATASLLINNSNYALENSYSNIFLNTSREAIFQFWAPNGFTLFENTVSPSVQSYGTFYHFAVNPNLVNTFEAGDLRKAAYTNTINISGALITYPAKYKNRSNGGAGNEYYMVLRLSEQYLIRAEARAQQNNMANAVADLNLIRARAGLTPLPTTLTTDNFMLALEHEHRVELCFEGADRWFNLKRTGRADAVLGAVKSGWKSSDALYPVPYSEIQSNPKLTQNPGY